MASALSGPGIWAARHPRSGLPLALVLLLPLPLVIGRAAAAEHVAESWVTVRSDYNSNLRYFRSGDDAVTSLGVSPGFRLSSLTPTDGLLLNGSLGAIRNDTIDPRNRLDVLAGLTWRQTGERDAIDVAATWTRDATLSVRTADAATNGQASQLVQTGQVFAWAERNQYTLAPTLMHALDERNRLGLVASAQVVRFRDAPAGLVDYDNLSLGPQWIRQADARTRYTLSLTESWYRPRVLANHTESTSLSAGVSRDISERLSYSLAIGLTRTSTHVEASYACQIPLIDAQGQPVLLVGSNADCAQLGLALTQVGSAADSVRYSPRYAAGLDWKATERDRVSIGVNRQVQPSAGGSTLDARYLQAAWTHDLTHRIAALVTGSQTVSHYTGNAAGHFEFRALSTSLRWQLDRRWSLEAGLGWSQALSGTGTGAPHANSVFLQLRHDFDRQAVSR